ncbi:UNVERIFIED_CONTAM: hypothetical protein Slati_2250800 [Sesamum latifolium]|uniref:Uncharacterized protein n=1 Tax=Sesamum latifolium TaxID=2727402 RepID=A0AAW2WVI7_9LAMI
MEDTPLIQFGRAERFGPRTSHNDALVITAVLADYEVNTSLYGFAGEVVQPKGMISLPLKMGAGTTRKTYHIPHPRGIGEVQGDHLQSRKCYVEAVRKGQERNSDEDHQEVPSSKKGKGTVAEGAPKEMETLAKVQPIEELMNIEVIPGSPDKTTHLEGIDPKVITHHLNIDPRVKPVRQKKRNFGPEKDKVIQAEVDKLMAAGHIEEIQFPEWLSNVVLVPKPGEKWRMCIDFRDLNKACPKDFYPLPRIDQLVDSTSGCELLSMMDASQGYHQIMLAPEDRKRVSFITSSGTFCYVAMPFGLKNASATYQRLVDKIFQSQIGRNVEAVPYFLSHAIGVKTNTLLKQTLEKSDTSGRLVKWDIELSEYDISYVPRTTIKAKLWLTLFQKWQECLWKTPSDQVWLLHVDGSSTTQGSGAGVVITSPQGEDLEFAVKFGFKASNNETEYEALVIGIRMEHEAGARHLLAYSDSQLIVNQIEWTFEAKEESMIQYLQEIKELRTSFDQFQIIQIPREENVKADCLSKLASALEDCRTKHDRWEAAKLKRRATRFLVQAGTLYKRSYTHPLLRCLSTEEGVHVLREIHSGYCGAHAGTWTLANKALRAGYFWPTMKQDAKHLVSKCERCQKHSSLIHQPAEPLTTMLSPCPFTQWGIDIVGPFPIASGQRKFLLIAIDYFTKWVEAEPLARITEGEVMKFIWKNIVCRFGVPRE